jgi:hypothetical protein
VEQAMTRGVLTALVAALALGVAGSAGAAGPVVTYTISAGTQGDNGWYRSAVTVRIDVSADVTTTTCPVVYTFQSSSDTLSCNASDGHAIVQFQLQFRIDTAAPLATSATPDRAPDGGGWYRAPVTVSFSGNDTTSGIASCTSATYSGPDSGSASVSGTCRDNAGNVSAPASFGLRYDTTAPTVTATPSRQPDANGWYSHPVDVAFAGTDGGSGISSCTAPVTYSGPDSSKVDASGGCVDAAGNKASATATFQYDSTPPALARVAAEVSSRTATLTWKAPADAASVAVVRTPGRGGKRPSTVFAGRASTFRDRNLTPGRTYRYRVTVSDAAGNARAVDVKAAVPALYLPAAGARVRPGALLAWEKVAGASYYNVQIFRGSHKVLSVWPKRPTLRLHRTWKYAGKSYRLAPGRYRWYVWPGHGPLKAAKYGALVGGNTFVVRR